MSEKSLINTLILEKSKVNNLLTNIFLVLGGFLFIAIFAQLKIILPFTPVPITGGSMAVILIGLLYGKRLTIATLLTYIVAGTIGIPVFANFSSGLVLFGPSGGYIVGYFFASLICAYFSEKGYTKSYVKIALIILLANVVLYVFGLLQLSFFIGNKNVFMLGLVPFIPGDIIKMTLATLLVPTIWKIIKK